MCLCCRVWKFGFGSLDLAFGFGSGSGFGFDFDTRTGMVLSLLQHLLTVTATHPHCKRRFFLKMCIRAYNFKQKQTRIRIELITQVDRETMEGRLEMPWPT